MFDLSAADLGRRILGCGDGPASFNAELTAQGGRWFRSIHSMPFRERQSSAG